MTGDSTSSKSGVYFDGHRPGFPDLKVLPPHHHLGLHDLLVETQSQLQCPGVSERLIPGQIEEKEARKNKPAQASCSLDPCPSQRPQFVHQWPAQGQEQIHEATRQSQAK